MLGFWEKQYDVLVATTIVESGLDIPNANTLIVDRADMFGLVAAAPAARPGRPRPRARLRLLHLPARAAADRDRLRPAGHHRPAHRDGRGHGRRDEGPRDPRIRATCSAASSPATSPASASTSTCGWSARRSPTSAARRAEEFADVKVDLPVDANLPVDYLPGERLRLEAYRALAVGHHRRGGRRGARRAGRPLRADPAAGREPARRRPVQGAVPPLRRHRGVAAGQPRSASRRSTCPSRPSCGCSGSTTARTTSRPWRRCRCRGRRGVVRTARCATSRWRRAVRDSALAADGAPQSRPVACARAGSRRCT